MIARTPLFMAIAALSLAACKDPAKDAAKATVGEVAPAAAPAAPQAEARKLETLPISNANSKIGFVGSKVTGSHDGGFNTFSGNIQFDPAKAEASRIEIEIDMNSVFSDNENLTGHLKTGDFFLVEQHPTAKFVSTAITAGGDKDATHTISGNLTLRGVTKAITFPATVSVSPQAVTAKSEFALPRQQFGVAFAGKPDDLIRDDVVIKLDVNAPRTAAAAAPSAAPAVPAAAPAQ